MQPSPNFTTPDFGAVAPGALPAYALRDADALLGHFCLTAPDAQDAFVSAGVDRAWQIGRGPDPRDGSPARRIVAVLFGQQEQLAQDLFHRVGQLEPALSAACGVPVVVRCHFRENTLPTAALFIPIVPTSQGRTSDAKPAANAPTARSMPSAQH